MRDSSPILLINVLRATIHQLQESPNIDQSSPAVKELKRTLLEQILKLLANHKDSQLTVQAMHQVRHGIH
jgi:hypothetical protein